jgi:hypothetical protein
MMRKYLLGVFILISSYSFTQTSVEGNQSGTWTANNSPYLVIGQLIIPTGQTLTIEAGVEVNFQGYYKFTVNGNLQALGTENDSIVFTTDDQNTAWGGIRFNSSNGISNMNYCRIEFGKTSGEYPDIHGGAIALLSSDAVFSYCTFADNDATGDDNGMGGAVYGINTGSPTKFINCRFIRNHAYGEGGAVKFTSDLGTEFIECRFFNNDCNYGGGAISLYSVIGTKMTYCLFIDNYTMYSNGGAIHTLGTGNTLSLENCTLIGNHANYGDGGGVNLAYANASFVNCIIRDNNGGYSDNIYLDFGGAAQINYCNTPMPDGATGNDNINVDPLFQDPNSNNYQLQETSPCIDAGTDIGYEFMGTSPDMGCYEFDMPTSTNELNLEDGLAYPNPASDVLNIQNIDNAKNIEIFDITGKVVLQQKVSKTLSTELNISQLRKGTYFLRVISSDNQSRVQRFIKL